MKSKCLLLGYDIGSSSIKASLLDTDNGITLAAAISPKIELPIYAVQKDWAEQPPDLWWEHIVNVTNELRKKANFKADWIKAIGISYQMHGLVMVDIDNKPLANSIIWCDSRAVEIGNKAFQDLGQEACLKKYLNSPGNFTASKLKWVQANQPEIYEKIKKIMLPGDYIAYKMTGEICTTPSGLSEGIFWDYEKSGLANDLLEYYVIDTELIPNIVDTFSSQGKLTKTAAEQLGLAENTEVSYRAGDQPNNALSLNVMEPGEIAATAGTSGVVYGITEKASYDSLSRVNTFIHVNHKADAPHYGVLLCINGCGIANSWIRRYFKADNNIQLDYQTMNNLAATVPIGSDGLVILPFGNGTERILQNRHLHANIFSLEFNLHTKNHFFRAVQEGIIFAIQYGLDIMKNIDIHVEKVRAGNANMFLSPLFCEAFATVTNAEVTLYDTDGACGAARGAGIGSGIFKNKKQAFASLKPIKNIEPDKNKQTEYLNAYHQWQEKLNLLLKSE